MRRFHNMAHPLLSLALLLYLPLNAGAQSGTADAARIHRIETTVVDMPMGEHEPALRLDMQKLMQLYKVPGLSLAVIDNFKIVCVKTYGVIETGSNTPVTPRTLFQAGSISKPVAATGALYLVQKGKLSLDEDVNRKLQ